jgi:hypothetical protein
VARHAGRCCKAWHKHATARQRRCASLWQACQARAEVLDQLVLLPFSALLRHPIKHLRRAAGISVCARNSLHLLQTSLMCAGQSAHSRKTSSHTGAAATPASGTVAYDNELPDFLLAFVAEHVRSLEHAGAAAATSATNEEVKANSPRWTQVSVRKVTGERRPSRPEDVLTLYSSQLRSCTCSCVLMCCPALHVCLSNMTLPASNCWTPDPASSSAAR